MTTRYGTGAAGGIGGGEDAPGVLGQQDVAMAVNAFAAADSAAREGNENAAREQRQHLRVIQKRYWGTLYSILLSAATRRRGQLDLSDDERLFMDLGLVDARMLGGDGQELRDLRGLGEEIGAKAGLSGCFYLSEWLAEKLQHYQIESDIDAAGEAEENAYASQLNEARRRIISRLSDYFDALPGVPLELSEAVRSGDMARAIISTGMDCLRHPSRRNFLRRHKLWALREQVMAKARARADSQGALKLFDMLGEVHARDWRARYDSYIAEQESSGRPQASARDAGRDTAVVTRAPSSDPEVDSLLKEARRMRMRMVLMSVIDGREEPDTVLSGRGPRLTKPALADFLSLAQTFDRSLAELPSIVIVPGSGRGFFAWEAGCAMLALRPVVGVDDSAATAFAWRHMLDDRFNRGGALRAAYEQRFPGAVFQNDFPADYRAWLCRLPRGDAAAMQPERRSFFHEFIGPDVSAPLLPLNLRNVAPQTMAVIRRRLEKQVATDGSAVNPHRRLAAIYWQHGETEAAALQFNAAMQLAPDDGETLFSAGMFMRARGDADAANDCFRFGAERAANTMWGVYCKDALAGLI